MTPQESFFLQVVRERALATERDLEFAVRLREERGPAASIPDLLVGLGCINAAQREALLAETRPRTAVSDTPTLPGPEAATAIGPIGVAATAPGAVYPGYEVLEEIAHGGMGIVYKARQTALGRLAPSVPGGRAEGPRELGGEEVSGPIPLVRAQGPKS